MFRTKNTPVQITVPSYEEPLAGIVTTALALFTLVHYKQTGDARELVVANGGRVALLENDVISDADWQAYQKQDPQWRRNLRSPVPVGSLVTARFAEEAEFEGAQWFDGVDDETTPGTFLKIVDGQFVPAVLTVPDGGGSVDIPQARLLRLVTPVDSATFRWVIEFLD